MDIVLKIKEELKVEKWQVEAAIKLIDEGNSHNRDAGTGRCRPSTGVSDLHGVRDGCQNCWIC